MNFELETTIEQPEVPAATNGIRPQRVLFVCLGNICRSPTAQGIFSHLALRRSRGSRYRVDSAGTHDYHVGKSPDPRAIAAAARFGIDISQQRARQFSTADFERFDHILVMDDRNRNFLAEICPPEHAHKVKPIVSFAPQLALAGIPDPFHGIDKDFDTMVGLLLDACNSTLDALEQSAA
jgi:protein-tyrosine phosphatase